MENRLRELIEKNTDFTNDGFSIHFEKDTNTWHWIIQSMGTKYAYSIMADILCELFKEKYGVEFIFHEKCVAYEIAYHVNCYMDVKGYKGYTRPLSSYLLLQQTILDRCNIVDIYQADVKSFRQRVIFRYRKGIRKSLVGSERDPFRRFIKHKK
ncbi:MAG: hypothetical protein KBT48_05725 [Firmicutes bacterium]|nr:hypothetical protein [Bacillota bacterium]